MKLIELKKNESLNVPTRKVLVDFEHGYVFEPVYHKCNGLDTTQLNYTTVNRLDGYGFKQSPEEILAKLQEPDDGKFSFNERRIIRYITETILTLIQAFGDKNKIKLDNDTELKQAVRELVDAINHHFMTHSIDHRIDDILLKVKKLLGD